MRIGYISPDFTEHPVGYTTRDLYRSHDREQFRVYGYALRRYADSPLYRTIEAGCDVFADLSGLDDRAAAAQIRADGIDILVDLAVYTTGARPEILAMQPAPVQVAFHGLPGTSGSDFIDYKLTDRVASPPGSEEHWSEQPVYLPDCANPVLNRMPLADHAGDRADHGLGDASFVFCAFHNGYKIDPASFDAWLQLLGSVPGSQLWLAQRDAGSQARLRRAASQRGIEPARLVFSGREPDHARYLARYRLADLYLDSFSFCAMTTAVDALWAGLPVLTCSGDHFANRMGASIVRAAGLPELACASHEAYLETALALARQPDHLRTMSARLRSDRDRLPLFDSQRQVRNLEAAYTAIWDRQAQGRAPAALHIDTDASVPAAPSGHR